MKRLLYFICVLICINSCGLRDNADRQLMLAEDYIDKGKLDSARICLDAIVPNSANTSALHNLLRVRLEYMCYNAIDADTVLDEALDYFAKTNNKKRLAEVYYYRGALSYESGKVREGLKQLKKAEDIAESEADIGLRHKIYETLAYVNSQEEEHTLALKYSRKALESAIAAKNDNWMAYALNSIGCDFMRMAMVDSGSYYLDKSLTMIDVIPPSSRAAFITNVALVYLNSDTAKADSYITEAMKYNPSAATYYAIANMCAARGNHSDAERYWSMALTKADMPMKIDITKTRANYIAKNGDYKHAFAIADTLSNLKDSLARHREDVRVRELQLAYDHDAMKEKTEKRIYIFSFAVIVLSLLLLALAIYSRYTTLKNHQKIINLTLLANNYTNRIRDLESSGEDNIAEIESLRVKLEEIKTEQSHILYEGRELYDKICNNETTVTWSKKDFINFIEYYKLQDYPFVSSLETDYKSLSPKYMFFEILYHMGKSEDEIRHILGIGKSTVRTTRTRIKAKRISQNPENQEA